MPQYDVTLRDYWRILNKRKVIVFFATVMLGFTSYLTAYLSTPTLRYESTAKLQYEDVGNAQEAYIQALGSADALETERSVITSYPVLERVAHEMGFVDTLSATYEQRIGAILSLQSKVRTAIEGLTNIITITVTDSEPRRAQETANKMATVYEDYNYQTKNAQLINSRNFIRDQRKTVKTRLRSSQDKLKEFQETTKIVSVNAQIGQVLNELNNARGDIEETSRLLESIEEILKAHDAGGTLAESLILSVPPEQGGLRFAQLNSQLLSLNEERSRLMVTFTPRHPQVVDIDSGVRVLLKEMVGSLKLQREILGKRNLAQGRLVADLETQYEALPQLAIQLGDLQRDVRTHESLLLSLEGEYQKAQILENQEVRPIRVMQKALLPTSALNPSAPRTSAGIGALLGLILGVVFAFLAETLDTSIGTIQDVEEFLSVSVVGIIPQLDIDDMREALIRTGADPSDPDLLERRMRLAAHFEPQSTIAESYRALRTNIQFANLDKGAKVISVSSASHQEGKSTTIANLAMTLAQAGNRVLLVDGDLRRPTIAQIFGLDREPGLTDVILGNYAWQEVVRTVTDIMVGGLGMEDIMLTQGMDNLNIITSGVIPPNPAEITDSRRMGEFIQEVREAYDVILIDSPPILQATDATILGTKVDGVLLVYKIGNVSRSALRRAKLQLDNLSVPVLGVVINGLRAEISEDFKDLRYYSYYSYGSQASESVNPIVREFNRFKRRAGSAYNEVKSHAQGLLARVGIEVHIDATDAPPLAQQDSTQSSRSLREQIQPFLFWGLVGFFILMGLLWQMGIFGQRTVSRDLPTGSYLANLPESDWNPAPQEAADPSAGNSVQAPTDGEIPPPAASDATSPPPIAEQVPTLAGDPIVSAAVFGVHVGSYRTPQSARRALRNLTAQGVEARISQVNVKDKGTFYRLVSGQADTKEQAAALIGLLRERGFNGYAHIVSVARR